MPKYRPSEKSGFSLLELLVVISIIIILTIVGFSYYNNAQKNIRDQERMMDLNTISQYLELYRHDQLYYPSEFIIATASALTSPNGAKTYSDEIPRDSNPSRKYVYKAADCVILSGVTKCYSYALCALKEGNTTYSTPSGCLSESCGPRSCDMGIESR